MTHYSIVMPRFTDEGYGIKITTVRIVRDISPDLAKVKNIADKCNSCGLASIHFDDVLENYLSDLESF